MQTASNDNSARPRLRLGLSGGLLVPVLLVATKVLGVAWLSAWWRVQAPGPATAGELVTLVAATLAAGLGSWLLCGLVLELAARLPGRCGRAADGWSRRVTPTLARRVAGFVLGVGVGVAGGPAQAVAVGAPGTALVTAANPSGGSAPDPGFRPAPATPPALPAIVITPTVGPGFSPTPGVTPTPGFTPTPPRVRPQADPGLLGARVTPRSEDEVVVHRGDSLWSIAARHLGTDASDAEVDRSWRQWFALNRDVVGADPDLLLPGQVLRVPAPDESARAVR